MKKWIDFTDEQKRIRINKIERWRKSDSPRAEIYRKNKRKRNAIYLKRRSSTEPWFKTYTKIVQRCSPSNEWSSYYYDKGIRCQIKSDELKILWFRDKAYEMKKPSIDRIDSNKNYIFENCRYIEFTENCRLATSVLMRDSNGRFLKKEYK